MGDPKPPFSIPSAPALSSLPQVLGSQCFGRAPLLPMSKKEMDVLGWG
jgi:hypothetical protein